MLGRRFIMVPTSRGAEQVSPSAIYFPLKIEGISGHCFLSISLILAEQCPSAEVPSASPPINATQCMDGANSSERIDGLQIVRSRHSVQPNQVDRPAGHQNRAGLRDQGRARPMAY